MTLRKPKQDSKRCEDCKRICPGTCTYPDTWYCDYCKAYFGKMIEDRAYNLTQIGVM